MGLVVTSIICELCMIVVQGLAISSILFGSHLRFPLLHNFLLWLADLF
jgi:hypothetical protein